jgi:hypothetical protein
MKNNIKLSLGISNTEVLISMLLISIMGLGSLKMLYRVDNHITSLYERQILFSKARQIIRYLPEFSEKKIKQILTLENSFDISSSLNPVFISKIKFKSPVLFDFVIKNISCDKQICHAKLHVWLANRSKILKEADLDLWNNIKT